jgi:hypothetical protein
MPLADLKGRSTGLIGVDYHEEPSIFDDHRCFLGDKWKIVGRGYIVKNNS